MKIKLLTLSFDATFLVGPRLINFAQDANPSAGGSDFLEIADIFVFIINIAGYFPGRNTQYKLYITRNYKEIVIFEGRMKRRKYFFSVNTKSIVINSNISNSLKCSTREIADIFNIFDEIHSERTLKSINPLCSFRT